MMALFFVFFGFSTAFGRMVCPGSPSHVHAGMEVVATAAASCSYVEDEMKARINGQFDKWHDPHHNGTLSAHRRTGDDKYTDKMVFTLTDTGVQACKIEACSESQVFSIGDAGTNYCNLRMLYCGLKDGCKPVLHDIASDEEYLKRMAEASVNLKACLAV